MEERQAERPERRAERRAAVDDTSCMKRGLAGGVGPPKKMARASFEAEEEEVNQSRFVSLFVY